MKIVHFIASSKPWLQSFNTETRLVTATSGGVGLQSLLQLWWDLFCRHVHPALSTEMVCTLLPPKLSKCRCLFIMELKNCVLKIIVLTVCLN